MELKFKRNSVQDTGSSFLTKNGGNILPNIDLKREGRNGHARAQTMLGNYENQGSDVNLFRNQS